MSGTHILAKSQSALWLESVRGNRVFPRGDAIAICHPEGSYLWRLEGLGGPIRLSRRRRPAVAAVSPILRLRSEREREQAPLGLRPRDLEDPSHHPQTKPGSGRSLFYPTGPGSPPEAPTG